MLSKPVVDFGAGREAGDRLCQFVTEQGQVVAVLIWCAAAWHIKDRDTLIGWDPVTRSQRLKLVVQLRRFLVPEKVRRPNLASQCLGLGLRELPAQWLAQHGYRPLMAESFSDPESHAGTVYRATNWTCAGDTKGFSQDHTDYYLPNERPKKIWLKPLDPKAATLLCAPHLPVTGKKEDCEVSEARALLADPHVKLENALVTSDSLHNKEPTLRIIIEKGGDYLIGTKENTSKRLTAVEAALEGTPLPTD